MSSLTDSSTRLVRLPTTLRPAADTVLESLSALAASVAAEAGADQRILDGRAPILLDRTDRLVYIVSGSVDLFLVALADDGTPTGTRHFFCGFSAGDLLFGADGGQALLPVGLIAVGTVGTHVLELPLEGLRAQLDRGQDAGGRPDLAGALDRWVLGVSGGASGAIVPRPRADVLLAQGESRRVRTNQRASIAQGVGWVDLRGLSPLFLDDGDFSGAEADAPIPLCAASWVSLGARGQLACEATAIVLSDGRVWTGLAALNAAVIETAPLTLRIAAVDEANRLRARIETDGRAVAQAFAQLGRVVSPDRPAPAAVDLDDRLFQAAAAVLEATGIEPRPPRRAPDATTPLTLDDIFDAAGVRQRQIRLEPGWWRTDVGPFLLAQEEGAALAILPHRGGYARFDAATGERRALTPREAAALTGNAYMVYEPLPDRPLRLVDLFRRVVRYGRSDLLDIVGFGLLGGLLALAVPVATGYMIDTVIPNSDRLGLFQIGVVLLLVAAVQFLLALAIQRAVLRLEGVSGSRLQAAVMDRLLRLPPQFFQGFTAGDLAVRALAIRRIEDLIGGSLVNALLSSVFSIASFGLMFYYSTLLGWVALAIGLTFVVLTLLLGIARMRAESTIVRLRGELSGQVLEYASGVSKLRLAAAEDRVFGRWARTYAALEQRSAASRRIDLTSGLVVTAISTVASIAVFTAIVQGDLLTSGLGLGSLVAFLSALSQGMGGLGQVAGVVLNLAGLQPVLRSAAPILSAVPEATAQAASPGIVAGDIELAHVQFAYGRDLPPVFADLTLRIRAGEYVAVVGPSGAGKSSIIRLLLGFEQPQRGAVLIDGKDLRGLDVQALRRQMGVVLQQGRLYGASLLDNILGANRHLGEREAWAAAEHAGLGDDIRAMPMGMQTILSEGTLSGGQVQRVMIARAIIHEPRIVILDEATSALDNRTQAVVAESLARMSATRIVVAHRLSSIVSADRIIVIDGGHVVESGSYADLWARDGLFKALALRQLTEQEPAAPAEVESHA